MFEINDNDLSSNDSSSNDASSDDASSKDVSSSSSSSNLDESVKSIRLHLDPSVTELVEPEPDPEISTNQGKVLTRIMNLLLLIQALFLPNKLL